MSSLNQMMNSGYENYITPEDLERYTVPVNFGWVFIFIIVLLSVGLIITIISLFSDIFYNNKLKEKIKDDNIKEKFNISYYISLAGFFISLAIFSWIYAERKISSGFDIKIALFIVSLIILLTGYSIFIYYSEQNDGLEFNNMYLIFIGFIILFILVLGIVGFTKYGSYIDLLKSRSKEKDLADDRAFDRFVREGGGVSPNTGNVIYQQPQSNIYDSGGRITSVPVRQRRSYFNRN